MYVPPKIGRKLYQILHPRRRPPLTTLKMSDHLPIINSNILSWYNIAVAHYYIFISLLLYTLTLSKLLKGDVLMMSLAF